MSDAIVKNLSFGDEAREKVFEGINKLTNAVSSTLGAGGKCVMLEDGAGKPVITKDGVTVADSIILLDPVENMGATLLKEAARKTVREAGDGTTRDVRIGIEQALKKTLKYLDKIKVPVKGDMIDQIATISTNNDPHLGKIIGNAFRAVNKTGVVMMEMSDLAEKSVQQN